MTVTTDYQVCPTHSHGLPKSTCLKCTYGYSLLEMQVKLETDVPGHLCTFDVLHPNTMQCADCMTWFVKADAAVRSITTSQRTFVLNERECPPPCMQRCTIAWLTCLLPQVSSFARMVRHMQHASVPLFATSTEQKGKRAQSKWTAIKTHCRGK